MSRSIHMVEGNPQHLLVVKDGYVENGCYTIHRCDDGKYRNYRNDIWSEPVMDIGDEDLWDTALFKADKILRFGTWREWLDSDPTEDEVYEVLKRDQEYSSLEATISWVKWRTKCRLLTEETFLVACRLKPEVAHLMSSLVGSVLEFTDNRRFKRVR